MIKLLQQVVGHYRPCCTPLEDQVKNTKFKTIHFTQELTYNQWMQYIYSEAKKAATVYKR